MESSANNKKRDIKAADKSEEKIDKKEKEEPEKKHRMGLNFNLYVGDDTGLIKKVKMVYSYQTDIVGSYVSHDSFKKSDDEVNQEDEELKKKRQEDFSVAT